MPLTHNISLIMTGVALGAYTIYKIKSFWSDTERERHRMHADDQESILQKLMRYQRYLQIAQNAYDVATVYGPPLYEYLRGEISN